MSQDYNLLYAEDKGHDLETMAEIKRAEQAGIKILENNLKTYLKRIKNDKELKASFTGWISHLHPENVKLDDRLNPELNPHNKHKRIYDEFYDKMYGKRSNWFARGKHRSNKKRKKKN